MAQTLGVQMRTLRNQFRRPWYMMKALEPTVQATSVLTKAKINHVESHAMTLDFILQADMNQIFQMRYCLSL